MLTISGKALGRKKPLFADWSLPIPPEMGGSGGVTLRDLVARVVRAEVEAFRRRQSDRQMFRVLTAKEIADGANKGKIQMGGSDLDQEVDEEEAIAAALQAFEDGLYLVILDGIEHKQLDQQVYLHPETRMTFLRLTLLAGG